MKTKKIMVIFSLFVSMISFASVSDEEFISGKINSKFDKEWVSVTLEDQSKAKVRRSLLEKFDVKIRQNERFFLVEISNPKDIER